MLKVLLTLHPFHPPLAPPPARPASRAAFSPRPSSASLQPTLVFYFSPMPFTNPLLATGIYRGL